MNKLTSGFGFRHRRALLALVVILLVGLGVYTFAQPSKSSETATVTRGNIRATVSANARVRALHSARLAFPPAGLLAHMLVQEGYTVKAGEVIAELQPDEFDRRVKQAELNLAARQLDLERAQAAPRAEDLDIAQLNLKKAALALGVVEDNQKKNPSAANDAAKQAAQADYDIARDNFDRLTRGPSAQDVQQLKNSIAAAQFELEAARAARAQTQLRAPYAGIITEVNAREGELIGGYQPVVSLADLSSLELFAEIDEIDVGAVAEEQTVEIHLDAFPGKTLNGKLKALFPAASNERGAYVYHARISFERGELAVRPGMGATIKIATVERNNVLLVPTRAIKNAGTQKIVAAQVNGALRNIVVQTGLSDGNQTEIVSGLDQGATVVVE